MQLHVHLIGIGGAGMSALARLYLATGAVVSGSDATESPVLDDLRRLGATISAGHHAAHVASCLAASNRLVVASSAIPERNPELVAARASGATTIKHAEALASFVNNRRGIAVAGSHGKTTTTAMVTLAMRAGGLDPSFQVGGELVDLNTSADIGSGEWMVVEADEFDRRFLAFTPEIAVLTNVEPEHFECYDTIQDMDDAFVGFLERVKPTGTVIASRGAGPARGEQLERLLARGKLAPRGVEVIRYALDDDANDGDWVAGQFRAERGGSRFFVTAPDGSGFEARLAVPGRHNAMNALGACIASVCAGIPASAAFASLQTFRGVRRRYQLLLDGPVRVIEDYAHHPTEIRATLTAARATTDVGRLWAVFQPHLRIRTERLFDDFVEVLALADHVVLADVYSPAGREPDGNYRGAQDIVTALRVSHSAVHSQHAASDDDVVNAVVRYIASGDVIVVMGAGPIDRVGREIARQVS
jgi:UDP-N-acetylmuramate--alanine ligase